MSSVDLFNMDDLQVGGVVFAALTVLMNRLGTGDLDLSGLDDYQKHILFSLLDTWGQFE